MKKINYLILSDVHIGALPNDQLFGELNQVLDTILLSDSLDLIAITGDLFHKKIDANTDVSETMKFMHRLIVLAIQKNAKVRIIKGTHSHDLDQLDMFKGIDKISECDFRVIDTVESEHLFPGFNVLYIPEEYVEDVSEYYGEYFSQPEGTYQMILGHGVLDIASFASKTQESELTKKEAPVLPLKNLQHLCPYGPIYFGHIHKPTQMDNFRYVGSFSVWVFGEEEDKGFITGTYHIQKERFEDTFVINKERRRYTTIYINENNKDLFKKDPNEILSIITDTVSRLLADNKADFVRVHITIPVKYKDTVLLSRLLEGTYNRNRKVKVLVKSLVRTQEMKKVEETITDLYEQYGFLFSNEMTVLEKIAHYIEQKTNVKIPIEVIKKIVEKK